MSKDLAPFALPDIGNDEINEVIDALKWASNNWSKGKAI